MEAGREKGGEETYEAPGTSSGRVTVRGHCDVTAWG